jgi:hypothetical protein
VANPIATHAGSSPAAGIPAAPAFRPFRVFVVHRFSDRIVNISGHILIHHDIS